MKTLILIAVALFAGSILSFSGVIDPLHDFASSAGVANHTVYLWKVDLTGDGRKEVLLDTKLTPQEETEQEEETKYHANSNVHAFTVYIAKPGGSGYVKSTGVAEDGIFGPALPEIDLTQCYVGPIKQLNRFGLVTVQEDNPRRGTPVDRIYAYTIDGDHLIQTKLAEFNPEKDNAIYNEYLSDARRTKVQLQEVTP
ncbi:MAG TPA: hypothetical protein VHY22_04010 [Chthoniobacteraceae bacterium]|jgi:hypothetical protein|nr:hypothetical protein [Chthoniobacteraceae bacterium]